MVRSILAALDRSPRAPAVFAVAHELAERFTARLFLFRVVEPPIEFVAAASNAPDPYPDQLREQARQELESLARGHPNITVVPPLLSNADPWHAILETGKHLDVDLIVIGSHAAHGVERVLGTVSSRVVNHADRNVLVVRQAPPPH